jgi:signal transduction histidine kinase
VSAAQGEVRASPPAERLLARAAAALLALGAVAAVAGPVINYRRNVAELRQLLRARSVREAHLFADALDRHLRLMVGELARLSEQPEVDLKDDRLEPEQELLVMTRRLSVLFEAGVSVADLGGERLWSAPAAMPLPRQLSDRPWFQRLLATQAPVVDVLDGVRTSLVVAVPILRDGKATGVVIGLLDPRQTPLPLAGGGVEEVALVDASGDVLSPSPAPPWMRLPDLPARAEALLRQPQGGPLGSELVDCFASAAVVGQTGLRLLSVVHEDRMFEPLRRQVRLQLLLIGSLQAGVLMALGLYLRHTYLRFLDLESRAQRQEKLAALGGASLLIAHEVKNSLNGLNAAASLLALGGDVALPSQTIRGQVDRLRHLASSLLQFARPAPPQRVPTALEPLVSGTVEGMRALPEAGEVEVCMQLEPGLTATCDPLLLTTALDNLLRNAIEAGASARDVGRRERAQVRVALRALGSEAFISVDDDAGGPPPEVEARLFEPFLTSKPKGIGLGLSMARAAIEAQGGALDFARTPQGSTFTIRLPMASVSSPAGRGHSGWKP